MVKFGLVVLRLNTNLCPTRGSSVSMALMVWINWGEKKQQDPRSEDWVTRNLFPVSHNNAILASLLDDPSKRGSFQF